ncbi:MAG: sulfotransferase [Planctomycetes bacterium]|nr:sulfotransferase [Planctomycetota bacterium]
MAVNDCSADAPMKRVFIVGCRRSGTTWTMLLLGQHPRVVALQQIDFFRRLAHFGRWFTARDDYGTCALTPKVRAGLASTPTEDGLARVKIADALPPSRYVELVRPLADAVYSELAAVNPNALALVEQTPEYVQVWEEILRVFPDAYFLHVVRDPRSVFCSHKSAAKSWADPTRFSHDPLSVGEEWVSDVSRARKIAGATPRYHEVRYESLRREPVQGLAAILRWLELPFDEALCERAVSACSLDKLRAGNHAPKGFFRKGEVSGWKAEMRAGELRALEHAAGSLMRELGYEPLTPAHAPAPIAVRWQLARRGLAARFRRWAWESKSPLRQAAARTLKSVPLVRKVLLRRVVRPDQHNAA